MSDKPITLDRKLRTLEEAEKLWKIAALASTTERIELAKDLHGHGMFSLRQLAKICRTSVPSLSRRMTANSGGGRFEPESLSLLILMRQKVLKGEEIGPRFSEMVEKSGTSLSCAARLTGASYSNLYKNGEYRAA